MKSCPAYLFAVSASNRIALAYNPIEVFVNLRMAFFREFQGGLIFSTRFGLDFFEEVAERLRTREPLEPIQTSMGVKLGEFDKNFNVWLEKQ